MIAALTFIFATLAAIGLVGLALLILQLTLPKEPFKPRTMAFILRPAFIAASVGAVGLVVMMAVS